MSSSTSPLSSPSSSSISTNTSNNGGAIVLSSSSASSSLPVYPIISPSSALPPQPPLTSLPAPAPASPSPASPSLSQQHHHPHLASAHVETHQSPTAADVDVNVHLHVRTHILNDYPLLARLAAGGVSCMVASAILNPMDVIKVRLQTQNQLTPMHGIADFRSGRYHGFSHAFLTILREEGFFRGLMKGLTPSMMREASYSSLRLGLYDFFKGIFAPHVTRKEDFTLWQKILAGGASGAVGSCIANPTDLVKIRFQAATPQSPHPYRHTLHAFYSIAKADGIRHGLYRGALPTTIRASILTAAQLSSYDHSKRYMLTHHTFDDGPRTHLVASVISGLVATTATNPVDLVKTRMMVDSHLFTGPLDCFIKTIKHEGPQALMKGWVPNYLRLGPHFIISMPLLEAMRTLFGAPSV